MAAAMLSLASVQALEASAGRHRDASDAARGLRRGRGGVHRGAALGDDAAINIRDLRSLLGSLRLAKRTAVQTAVRIVTTGVLLALMAGIAIKLKLFGNGP
ncbi:MAG: DUF6127 family protein [Dehalococcoidia bacterium]